ncbi:MAG TPA: RNA polymerase sigma-70 factor [Acidimicrobiales bacterium]|nr:RNA polymerase sigma-70 factor [Acidimicrobiales bacterium]
MTAESSYGEEHEALRPLLLSIAYRMVGSVTEAEDLVQDAYLRFHRAAGAGEVIESAKAYLLAIVTHLAMDHLRSARVRREQYVGSWLPEPLVTDGAPDPAAHAETADSLSMAFLVLLESLSPVERAVFLLREVFAFGYDEVARMVHKTEDNCRQIATRARRHVEARRPRFEASRRQKEELAHRFFAAVGEGDLDGLMELLAADVVMMGDGGGKVPAIRQPLHGRERVARFLVGVGRRLREAEVRIRPAEINGQPGAITFDKEGHVLNVVSLDIADGHVQTVHGILNPDKLRHLGPVADVGRLVREGRADLGFTR